MKLVDILAREITEWPKGQPCLWISDAHSATIYGKSGSFEVSFNGDWPCPEDYLSAIVYKAEWQAAVDALKAGEVSYSAENVSAEVNYATHTDAPINPECKIVHPDWNGEGLPPVGTVCAVLNSDLGNATWERCTILYSGKHRVMYDSESCEERVAFIEDLKFRPARAVQTPERTKACDKMFGVILSLPEDRQNNRSDICEALYDAGYRKFEIVDN